MLVIPQSLVPFVTQVQDLARDLSKTVSESKVVLFVNKHESALCDLMLLTTDIYCLKEASIPFLATYALAICKPDYLSAASTKILSIWNEHPKTQPLLVGGAVVATALYPNEALSVSCGIFSAQRTISTPSPTPEPSWTDRAFNRFWSNEVKKSQ